MNPLSPYVPADRRRALASGSPLPNRAQGAALFADVSGFTALTEALARDLGPKRGAEELTRQLNLIFDALTAEADRFGGSVITFGGDALTCWFDGAPAEAGLRAAACALSMQAAMRPLAQVATPAGGMVALSMKAAVATGPARRFLAGDPASQVLEVIAGHTLDEMALAESQARRGEVLLSPRAAQALESLVEVHEWRAAPEGRYAVVSGLRAEPETVKPNITMDLQPEQLQPWLQPPGLARLQAGQEQFLAEMRPATVLFIHFEGIDFDADDRAGAQLDAFMRWVQHVLARGEGSVLQVLTGDKGSHLYATFGAPIAHTDDARRAVEAALEICQAPLSLDFIRSVRIGAAAGRIWSGAYGGRVRRTFGALGEAVNLAARLMARAGPGEVWLDRRAAELAQAHFEIEPLGAMALKGLSEPANVFKAGGPRPVTSADKAGDLPLFGREAELGRLETALAQATAGQGRVLRLTGDSGLGKSHLAAYFGWRAARNGALVLFGAASSRGQDGSYAAWRQILKTLFDLPEAETPERQAARVQAWLQDQNSQWLERLPLLGAPLGLPLPDNTTTAAFDPRLRQTALNALVVDLLQAAASLRPALVMLDDADWLDEASTSLALAAARAAASIPGLLLVLIHQQPGALSEAPEAETIQLGELDAAAVSALMAYRLGGEPSALAEALVQTQAQGNPFFAEELVAAMSESGLLRPMPDGAWAPAEAVLARLRAAGVLEEPPGAEARLAAGADLPGLALGLPDSVYSATLERFDHLDEPAKLTLKVGSVIGRQFGLDVLARCHPNYPGRDGIQSQLEVFIEHQFASEAVPPPRPAYAFRHRLTHEVVYDTLLEAQQRSLHRAAGLALEKLRPEAVEQLAEHFQRAGLRDKLLVYLEKAAQKAQREYANETALRYYAQALELEPRAEWRRAQVDALHTLGRREGERAALQELEAMPDASAFDVAYRWGEYYESISDYPAARAALERALGLARDQFEQANEAACLAQLGRIARRQGEYEQARALYERALSLFPGEASASAEESRVLGRILIGLGVVLRQQGQFQAARGYYERALEISRANGNRLDEGDGLHSLGGLAHLARDFTQALAYYHQALATRRAIGDQAGEGTTLYNSALASQEAGDYGQAQMLFEQALRIHQLTGNRWEEGNVWNGLGILYQELGDLARADECLERGLELAREIGDEAGQAYLLSNLGLVLRDRGELSAAEMALRAGLALARTQGDTVLESSFLSYLGSVLLQARRPGEAGELAQAARQLKEQLGTLPRAIDDLATLAEAHLALDQAEEARARTREIWEMLEACGGEGPEFPQRDYFVCFQVWSALGEADPALAALKRAADLVQARAMRIADPGLRQSFLNDVPINRQIAEARASTPHTG